LELAQAETKRNSDELNIKIDEFTKYRRTKHAELTELQAAHDSLAQTAESTQVSLKALQSTHSAQSHQLTQALSKVQDLTGQLAEQETKFANEASGLKRLVSLMEEREKQVKETVENLENEWAGVGQKAEAREAALKDEIDKEKRGREQAEKRIKNLETVLEGMGRGELPIPGRSSLPVTPIHIAGTPGDLFNDGIGSLSPTIAIASRTQRGGKTFTEVYTEFVKLREDYAKKVMECNHLERTLQEVLAQIQERVSIISLSVLLFHSDASIRHLYCLNNVPSINGSRVKHLSLQDSFLKSSLNGMLKHVSPKRAHRNMLRALLRTNFSNSNFTTLGNRCKTFLERLPVKMIPLSLLMKILKKPPLNQLLSTRLSRTISFSSRISMDCRLKIRNYYLLCETWAQDWRTRNRSTRSQWNASRQKPSRRPMRPFKSLLPRWRGRRLTTRR